MTPEQKIKWLILTRVALWNKGLAPDFPCLNVDILYKTLEKEGGHWDAMEEIRSGEVETGLFCDDAYHYDSRAVAAQMPDGSWVGWTYWYGGGKHSEPGAVDWMDKAYDVKCHAEEKLVKVQTFSILK